MKVPSEGMNSAMKTTVQHTPGPWEVEPSEIDGHVAVFVTQKGGHGRICRIWHGRTCGESNGHLIAAAPDMYEALTTLENDNGKIPVWLWLKIQAAIAKAEGRQ